MLKPQKFLKDFQIKQTLDQAPSFRKTLDHKIFGMILKLIFDLQFFFWGSHFVEVPF